MKLRHGLAIVLALLVAPSVACGDDEEDPGVVTTTTDAPTTSRQVPTTRPPSTTTTRPPTTPTTEEPPVTVGGADTDLIQPAATDIVPEPPPFYPNCDAVRAAGAAPIHNGQPGYRRGLDSDGNGTGCE
jgi:hypothetical protein